MFRRNKDYLVSGSCSNQCMLQDKVTSLNGQKNIKQTTFSSKKYPCLLSYEKKVPCFPVQVKAMNWIMHDISSTMWLDPIFQFHVKLMQFFSNLSVRSRKWNEFYYENGLRYSQDFFLLVAWKFNKLSHLIQGTKSIIQFRKLCFHHASAIPKSSKDKKYRSPVDVSKL